VGYLGAMVAHQAHDGPGANRRQPRRVGQATVEFALVLPLFLLLTIGVVDLARIFSSYIAFADGVREAALFAADGTANNVRWCAPPPPDPTKVACPTGATAANEAPDPDNIAVQLKSVGLDASQITMLPPVCSPDPCTATSKVTIVASYRMPLLTPVIGHVLGGSVPMTVSTTAKLID
jgi:hypothetical protein